MEEYIHMYNDKSLFFKDGDPQKKIGRSQSCEFLSFINICSLKQNERHNLVYGLSGTQTPHSPYC